MVLPVGCVQPAMAPNIDAATARVCDAIGIELIVLPGAGCCGALAFHLDDQRGSLESARRNIDAWLPQLEAGAEALLINASGCGAMIREYGHLLRDDPAYAAKAARSVRARARSCRGASGIRGPAQGMPGRLAAAARRVPPAVHSAARPADSRRWSSRCSLRWVPMVLPIEGGHLCCGSAGAYSLLQPRIAVELRDRKLASLVAPRPDVILSANVGCIAHLAGGSSLPIRHWIEWLDARLIDQPKGEYRMKRMTGGVDGLGFRLSAALLAALLVLIATPASASVAVYVGKNLTADGSVLLAGYGDEPSSHWLSIVPAQDHPAGTTVTVGATGRPTCPAS